MKNKIPYLVVCSLLVFIRVTKHKFLFFSPKLKFHPRLQLIFFRKCSLLVVPSGGLRRIVRVRTGCLQVVDTRGSETNKFQVYYFLALKSMKLLYLVTSDADLFFYFLAFT